MTVPTKKSKASRSNFDAAHKACRTPAQCEQLARVIAARWTSAELDEYARLFFFKNKKDYPTAASYRKALTDIAGSHSNAGISSYAHGWRKQFRKDGSKIIPPRREGLLIRSRGQLYRVNSEEYAWPWHTEKYRSMIEQRARDYFKIPSESPVHVNAWAASQRAYWREDAKARKVKEVLKKPKTPTPPKAPRRERTSVRYLIISGSTAQSGHSYYEPKESITN